MHCSKSAKFFCFTTTAARHFWYISGAWVLLGYRIFSQTFSWHWLWGARVFPHVISWSIRVLFSTSQPFSRILSLRPESPSTSWAWIFYLHRLLCFFVLFFLTGPPWAFKSPFPSYWAEFPFLLWPKSSITFWTAPPYLSLNYDSLFKRKKKKKKGFKYSLIIIAFL